MKTRKGARRPLRSSVMKKHARPANYQPPRSDRGKPLTAQEAEEALARPQVERVAELLGGRKVLRRRLMTIFDAHDMIRLGFPALSVDRLLNTLAIIEYGGSSLGKALGISWRTVQRHKKTPEKRLSQEQSGRMWKFAEVLAKATEVFGSQRDAEQWMERPAIGLEQRRPIDLLETPAGAELVNTFLERLEYGVYT